MSINETHDLAGILRIKKDLLCDMLSAMEKAMELLAAEDTAAFDAELDRCTEIMSKVDELAAAEQKLSVSDAKDKDAAALRKEIELVIKKLSDAHAELVKASGEKLKSYGSRIKSLRQSKQGVGAYSAQINPDAIFIDAKQ